jgi:L-alanine-DL-glutamate epimerase-like enolase superfamily enzyme
VAAPVSVSHTHVHSLRLVSGAEELAARALLADGTSGFGFALNMDAGVARDMAAWDALGRSKGVPLHSLLGGSCRLKVRCEEDQLPSIRPDWSALRKGILAGHYEVLRIDPFAWGSVEMVQTIAAVANAFDLGVSLLAPNAHPWEIQYCVALAATIRGNDTSVIVRTTPDQKVLPVNRDPGVGVDWRLEQAFQNIKWQS